MEDKHFFTIKELCKSDTAYRLKIKNTPTPEIKENLHKLIEFLDPIREAWGAPIIVSSGFRCIKLNKAVNGSPTSSHLYGLAADLVPASGEIKRFKAFIKEYLENTKTPFDQVIMEKSGSSEWVHISPMNVKGEQRKMMFTITK